MSGTIKDPPRAALFVWSYPRPITQRLTFAPSLSSAFVSPPDAILEAVVVSLAAGAFWLAQYTRGATARLATLKKWRIETNAISPHSRPAPPRTPKPSARSTRSSPRQSASPTIASIGNCLPQRSRPWRRNSRSPRNWSIAPNPRPRRESFSRGAGQGQIVKDRAILVRHAPLFER